MYVSSPLGFPGSVPETVMRTGDIMTFNPNDIRSLISERTVERMTRLPVGMPPGVASYGPPPLAPFPDASAPLPSAVAGLGADGEGSSPWAWALIAGLTVAAGYAGYKATRG